MYIHLKKEEKINIKNESIYFFDKSLFLDIRQNASYHVEKDNFYELNANYFIFKGGTFRFILYNQGIKVVYKKKLLSSFQKLSGKSQVGSKNIYIRNELFLLLMCLGRINIAYVSLFIYFIYFIFLKMVDLYIFVVFSIIFSLIIILILFIFLFFLELFFM